MNWSRTRILAVLLLVCYLFSLGFIYSTKGGGGLNTYYIIGQVIGLGFSVGLAFTVATELVRNYSSMFRVPVAILVGLVLYLGLLVARWAVVPSTNIDRVLLNNGFAIVGIYAVSVFILELLVRILTSQTSKSGSEY
ncbi:hypothetical protein SAMN04487950_4048 [Halogranum rubrum]|uniref:Uncharacterized protein n=1 Tax=Halogranum rubrum TaxID=553466 RepID=A0A1I4I8G1_9EURY|nr:hypothetical protein [Halogranum rubrum]SFL50672.1 hypothetical protein SAMN04487950_4048 [Halogranum rubrum]